MAQQQDRSLRGKIFSRLFWDYNVSTEEIESMLSSGEPSKKEKVYLRLLISSQWYVLLNILSKEELAEALSENVISKIHIATLREKYQYARTILH
ncbi:MAG: hypothetical protein ABIQ40_05725 [Bacteroidia bacterium]